MSLIENRITKLEHMSRDRSSSLRVLGIPDDEMMEIRRVAATCGNADRLIAHLRNRLPAEDEGVVSLEDRRRTDAVLGAAARTIFDEVRS